MTVITCIRSQEPIYRLTTSLQFPSPQPLVTTLLLSGLMSSVFFFSYHIQVKAYSICLSLFSQSDSWLIGMALKIRKGAVAAMVKKIGKIVLILLCYSKSTVKTDFKGNRYLDQFWEDENSIRFNCCWKLWITWK